jgi:hypothetical protein
MKRILAALAAISLLVLGAGPVGAVSPLATLDLNTVSGVAVVSTGGSGGSCTSFNPEVSGAWGGENGLGAVTAFGATDPAGYCMFTGLTEKARHISLRVLDGIADDSFDVYVHNPGGNWALVYGYTADSSTAETWVTHHIYDFPAGKGQGDSVCMKIVPTNVGWWGFDTWGQLAVDYVKVWEH